SVISPSEDDGIPWCGCQEAPGALTRSAIPITRERVAEFPVGVQFPEHGGLLGDSCRVENRVGYGLFQRRKGQRSALCFLENQGECIEVAGDPCDRPFHHAEIGHLPGDGSTHAVERCTQTCAPHDEHRRAQCPEYPGEVQRGTPYGTKP